MNNIDILAIGDIATEPFIKIKESEAETKCDTDGSHCKVCLIYGGKVPYESAEVCNAVGNSSNVSIGASRLGLNSYLMSYVGDDNTGLQNIEKLKDEKVNTEYVNIISGMESNYHYVLWYGNEHTILTKHVEYPYAFPKELPEPKWIYFSSLASNSVHYHKEISDYLNSHPNISLAFQPGTFQIKLGTEPLKDIYSKTKVFLCNLQEAQTILNTQESDITKLTKMIYSLGPKIVVITDGINGSYSFDGKESMFMKAFPDESFVESTGAGDAFSGAFVSALSLGKEISEALIWGAANAKSVVGFVGPHRGLLTRIQLEEFIKNNAEIYKPIIIV